MKGVFAMYSARERVRAFISIDIEDPVVLGRLVSVRDMLVSTGAPMKPVEQANMHITIRFLGEIPVLLVDEVYNVMRQARFKPFRVRIVGLGAFPNNIRPRVLWAGVGEGSEQIREIYSIVERGLRKLGFRPEKEDFVPHITLARLKGRRNIEKIVRLLEEYRDYEFGEIIVNSIRLKQSILTRSGPIYRTLREHRAEES